jgi:hypothetical protein
VRLHEKGGKRHEMPAHHTLDAYLDASIDAAGIGHDGGGGMLVARRLHDPQRQGGINQAQFVHGLLDELIAMRQDEGPATAPLDQEGKDNGFARPRGQHEQRALHPACHGGNQGRDRFVLVRPGREPEGGRRLDNSLHTVRSHVGDHGIDTRDVSTPSTRARHVCLRRGRRATGSRRPPPRRAARHSPPGAEAGGGGRRVQRTRGYRVRL